MARPMPRLPPVTIATRPSNFIRSNSCVLSLVRVCTRRRPDFRKPPPHLFDARLIGDSQCRIAVREVELFQRYPRAKSRFAVDRARTFENVFAISPLVHGRRDGQSLARLHEVVVS